MASYKIQARERDGQWVTVDILFCAADAWDALHMRLIDRPSSISFRMTCGGIIMYKEGEIYA